MKRRMTDGQALQLAFQRWGMKATTMSDTKANRFKVGVFNGGKSQWYGEGNSWEAAFGQAEIFLVGQLKGMGYK